MAGGGPRRGRGRPPRQRAAQLLAVRHHVAGLHDRCPGSGTFEKQTLMLGTHPCLLQGNTLVMQVKAESLCCSPRCVASSLQCATGLGVPPWT